MQLTRLHITNFKNIADANLSFSPNINALLGDNGMGKSNLLDAIYYLSFCKSFTGLPDAGIVRSGETFTMMQGDYLRRETEEQVQFGYAAGKRKSFKRGGKEYSRLSQHIGLFPLVLVSPADMELVSGAAEMRRRFIDMLISQTDAAYLSHLIRYNTSLQQRNRMLRDHIVDHNLYIAVEMGMEMSAEYITNARLSITARLRDIFRRHYHDIARTPEVPDIAYTSTMTASGRRFSDLLDEARRKDEIVGHTTVGPHRDDLELTLDSMPVKSTASQGQSKTFTIALRLAQYEFMHEATGMRPLLLLDDIFDKLDRNRVANIIDIVNRDIFGQIFITDTNRDHLDSIMSTMTGADYRLWNVSSGCFQQIK
ncbi:MAG: DNA replication and repair protein RecF [Muribaculaceae bacterium]|nr:DNA replication and repair protein RecF [Muribaculaceae bacterium]